MPSASAWCRRTIGRAVRTAFRISFATWRICGLRASRISLSTRNGRSAGSARSSSAASIRSLTRATSSASRAVMDATSICSWLLRCITSPVRPTISPRSISGYARTPASMNAAAFPVPDSSTIVKIVGPDVCLTCAISPSMSTVLPILFPMSAMRTLVVFFVTFRVW